MILGEDVTESVEECHVLLDIKHFKEEGKRETLCPFVFLATFSGKNVQRHTTVCLLMGISLFFYLLFVCVCNCVHR